MIVSVFLKLTLIGWLTVWSKVTVSVFLMLTLVGRTDIITPLPYDVFDCRRKS